MSEKCPSHWISRKSRSPPETIWGEVMAGKGPLPVEDEGRVRERRQRVQTTLSSGESAAVSQLLSGESESQKSMIP